MAEYNNDGADQLVNASKKPDVVYLNNELQRSLFDYNNFAQVSNADDIRLCRWTGQTDDGKKHSEAMPDGEQVFPFEGASDVRTRLVDSTCNELSCLKFYDTRTSINMSVYHWDRFAFIFIRHGISNAKICSW